ncbi:MAG: hypothetical protein K2Q01_06375, partial [Rickettsiales bacterium]|nr:hypothetical protein [Rickettsiales bacterium]
MSMNKSFSLFLDASRWVAALVVMISHVRHIVLVDYAEVEQKNVLVQALYFVTGLGHESVMIFFVIIPILAGAFGNYLIPLMIG